LANVISTVFGQHEGSFLAGALAAWTTKSGRIGFIGGKDMPVIRAFLIGFREGATYARDDIRIDEVFLSAKDEESSGFDNPALAYTEADSLYDRDVDIIFSVAGLSGNGIIRAAVQNEKFVIGVDADQDHMAKGRILTSVMKRLDRATVEALRRIIEGDFSPGILYFGLREDGVALSPMTYTHDMFPPEILEKINSLRTRIITGEIVVTNYLEKNT
jgi:basic membrane protein A